jgi:hypothetical protein
MDLYHVWFDAADGVKDTELADAMERYFGALAKEGRLASWRITRRKLGLGHPALPEWHVILEFEGLAQLDLAFGAAASRADPVESLHHAVNSRVRNVAFALYRDFPDPVRVRGQEAF